MEKKLSYFSFSVDLKLKENEIINLDELSELCKELKAEYNPEMGFKSVEIKMRGFHFKIFRNGKIMVYGRNVINEKELDSVLKHFFDLKIKKCLVRQ